MELARHSDVKMTMSTPTSASTIRPVPMASLPTPKKAPDPVTEKEEPKRRPRRKVGSGWAAIQASRNVFWCHPLAQVDAMRVRSRNAKTLAGARVLNADCRSLSSDDSDDDQWRRRESNPPIISLYLSSPLTTTETGKRDLLQPCWESRTHVAAA